MSTRLTDEQKSLVETNINLAYFAVHKYLNTFQLEYEDLLSICYYGLVKSAQYFDPSKGVKFSTYAMKTILGYIKTESFPRKPQIKALYLEELLPADTEGKHLDWEQILPAAIGTEGEVINNIVVEDLASKLSGSQAMLLQHMIGHPDEEQRQTAEAIGVSQAQISRLKKSLREQIKKALAV